MSEITWTQALADACAATSQREVAALIGYSESVISQALAGKYRGDIKRVRAAVEGALLGATVDCPVLGPIPRQRCIEHQRRPFAPTNPTRVQLWRTCPTCPNKTQE
ncbi:conserved hypothetical protein [Thiomonas sp. CB3]|nr:conserved hypothetical protein [Thiomonas sp. CB3]